MARVLRNGSCRISHATHCQFFLHNLCIPIMVIYINANVFTLSAIFTVMLGTNRL